MRRRCTSGTTPSFPSLARRSSSSTDCSGRTNPLLVDLEGDPEAELKKLRDGINRRLPPRDDSPYFEFHPSAKSDDYPDPRMHHLGIDAVAARQRARLGGR